MGPIVLELINLILRLISLVVFVWVVLSWLTAFDVVNPRNRFVNQLSRFLDGVTAPLLRPIRRIVPMLGGADLSPLVLLLAIWFVGRVLNGPLLPFFGSW